MTDAPAVAAIVLAGGRASRLGGVDKPQLVVDGASLLDHAVRAVAWCDPIVVVGPTAPVAGEVVWTRETPEFGGPTAAIAAGLALIDRDEVCILAADLPRAVDAVALLRRHPTHPIGAADGGDSDGVCLADADGRAQWLIGRYRTAALQAALHELPDAGRNASVRALVSGLRLRLVAPELPAGGALPAVDTSPTGDDLAADALVADVDTWDDLERARSRAAPRRASADEEPT